MIYFDYNGTAPLQEKIFSKINLLNIKNLANPSSVHKAGRNSIVTPILFMTQS
ncbi:MAG: hypothetical protein ACKO5H_04945 [Candidatus Fonsibacter sp.]